jgi:hypothetical protein
VQLQAELCEALGQGRVHRAGILFVLEADHQIVRVTHEANFSSGILLTPLMCPQIERVVQVHVR